MKATSRKANIEDAAERLIQILRKHAQPGSPYAKAAAGIERALEGNAVSDRATVIRRWMRWGVECLEADGFTPGDEYDRAVRAAKEWLS